MIGVFVFGAVALGATVLVVWGSGRFFRPTVTFVSYLLAAQRRATLAAAVLAASYVLRRSPDPTRF